MENTVYNSYARLEVTRVESEPAGGVPDTDHSDDGRQAFDGPSADVRMLATRVLCAYCECKAGADSLCHQIAMLLQ